LSFLCTAGNVSSAVFLIPFLFQFYNTCIDSNTKVGNLSLAIPIAMSLSHLFDELLMCVYEHFCVGRGQCGWVRLLSGTHIHICIFIIIYHKSQLSQFWGFDHHLHQFLNCIDYIASDE
jgi:hypothetical protein